MRIAFIGHRQILDNTLFNRLYNVTEQAILSGCFHFSVGCHGEFDRIALGVLLMLKRKYKNMVIEVVLTSLSQLRTMFDENQNDIQTVMYEIEEMHYKQKIIYSNRKMLDNCDAVICYVNPNKVVSGAKQSLNYAKKKSIPITNLFEKAQYNNKE
ncbi:MAG TPA: hypothetical protein IAD47_02730 [Candidatus Limihabitans stercoravium]|nr:hypothetical protein [Candidatus Limihabitans stercoravium]